tara:strand:- start:7359 stop:7631 length:273 start_codon:yes stop_codon:yes gene_type:complete
MDPFIQLLIFIFSTSALIVFLMPWLERRSARANYTIRQRQLAELRLTPPEQWKDERAFDLYEHECTHLRNQMERIRADHNLKPIDSFKPF